jgi:hypothetical protein
MVIKKGSGEIDVLVVDFGFAQSIENIKKGACHLGI